MSLNSLNWAVRELIPVDTTLRYVCKRQATGLVVLNRHQQWTSITHFAHAFPAVDASALARRFGSEGAFTAERLEIP